MENIVKIPAILLLEDGKSFHGTAIGKIGTTTGEICFNTGMTGYQEIFTDPSYFGQILVATNDHIGNYGTSETEVESDSIKIAGLVCKNYNIPYSRQMANQSIQDYFLAENLVGIADVDTREIVRYIRQKGAMNAIISSEITDLDELKQKLADTPSMQGLELSSKVTTKQPYNWGKEDAKYKVAVLDLGVKRSILNCIADRGAYLNVFPAKTTYEEMKKWGADAYFISNGPGDPAVMPYAVETVKQIIGADETLFGICLGSQILAESFDISTYKMHNGHRGLNHPVRNLATGRCEITSQNHGFAVNMDELKNSDKLEVTHINLNDHTVEGVKVKGKNAFAVQYHPEASPGPHDSRYLFDDFIELIKNTKN